MANNSLLINNTKVATDEVATRLRTSLGSMTIPQAALCFAFYNDEELVHFSSLDAAEKALFAPQSFGQFLLPRQGAANTQWAPCLVRTPEGDPLTLIWYATYAKNGNFTQVGEYFDTRNNRDMGKMAIPMTLEELGKLSARFQMSFISPIKTLPRDVRAASVQTQNVLSLASKKVNAYYTSLNSNAQVRTAPNFLKIITASNSVAVQLITNCIFPKPSSAPAVDTTSVPVDEDEEDEDLRSLTVSDLLSQQTEAIANGAETSLSDGENGIRLKDLPDPHGHFQNLMRQYDVTNMRMIAPCVRDAHGHIIQPTEYAAKLVDGAFLRVSANLQTYQFTNRTGTLVRVLQLRLVTMDVLPSTLEGIITKHPVAVAKYLAAFEALRGETEDTPSFADIQARIQQDDTSLPPGAGEHHPEKAVTPTETPEVSRPGEAPSGTALTDNKVALQNLPFGEESLTSASSVAGAAGLAPPGTSSEVTTTKRGAKRRPDTPAAGNKSAGKRSKANAGVAEDMEGVEATTC